MLDLSGGAGIAFASQTPVYVCLAVDESEAASESARTHVTREAMAL
jgi:hypothetical protein